MRADLYTMAYYTRNIAGVINSNVLACLELSATERRRRTNEDSVVCEICHSFGIGYPSTDSITGFFLFGIYKCTFEPYLFSNILSCIKKF
jgi:hypothetical protein